MHKLQKEDEEADDYIYTLIYIYTVAYAENKINFFIHSFKTKRGCLV